MIILWVLLPIAMMVQTCVAAPIRPDEAVAAFDDTIANYMQSVADIVEESEKVARKLYDSLPETEEYYKLRLDLEKYMNEVTKNKLDADNVSIDAILSVSSLIDLIDKHQDLTTEEEPPTHAINEEEFTDTLVYEEQTTVKSMWDLNIDETYYEDLTTEEVPTTPAGSEEDSPDEPEEQTIEKSSTEEENSKETSFVETTAEDITENAVTKPPITQNFQAIKKLVALQQIEKTRVEYLKEALRYTLANAKRDQGNYFLNLMVNWDRENYGEDFTQAIKLQYPFLSEECDHDMVCVQEIVEKGRLKQLLRQMLAMDTTDEAAKLKSDVEALLKKA